MFDETLLKKRLLRKKDTSFFVSPLLESLEERASLLKLSSHAISRIDLQTYLDRAPLAPSDLILCFMCLHWISDVQGFLKDIHQALNPKGAFQGCFVGGNSLGDLRLFFMQQELDLRGKVYPRFSPLIDEISLIKLLSQAGFCEIVVDREQYEFEYSTLDNLIKDLRDSGQTNALLQGKGPFPRELYTRLKKEFKKTKPVVNIDILYWSCFKQ